MVELEDLGLRLLICFLTLYSCSLLASLGMISYLPCQGS